MASVFRYTLRVCIPRHPRRYFFTILVLSGLLFWQSNIFGIRLRDLSNNLQGGSSDHDHDHQHKRQTAVTMDFIVIKDVELVEVNKLLHVKDISSAKAQCIKAKDRCIGFVHFRESEMYLLVKKPVALKRGLQTVYLKPSMIEGISFQADNVQCIHQAAEEGKTNSNSEGPGCRLPELNPWDQTIHDLIQPMEAMECPGVLYTSYQQGLLKFIRPQDLSRIKRISYQPIFRSGNDESFEYGSEESLSLDDKGVNLSTDFIQVNTHFTDGEIQIDYHSSVVPKSHAPSGSNSGHGGIPINIIILGLDGNSHANFQRFLPESYKFLKDELNAFIFKGFSLLGEATTPQLTGLLTGKTVEDNCAVHEARTGEANSGTVDDWPFIFKALHRHGYATLFSEDAPAIAAFNLRLNGFQDQPSHHYSRHFWWAVPHDDLGIHDNCLNSKPQHVLHLDYLRSFLDAYPNRLKFGFTFLSSLCHQKFNMVSSGARDVHHFLQSLKPYLNTTMLVVMGDHGARFDEIRSTLQGKLEERLPFLAIALPEWFRRKYPGFSQNLQANTQRIISPLDVYATFMHLLKFPESPSKSALTKGTSLFEFLPSNRECKDASVPEHFCPCMVLRPIPINNSYIQIGALLTVNHINKMLSAVTHLCHRLELVEIISAVQRMPNKKVQRFNGIKNGIGLGVGEPIFNDQKQIECTYEIQLKTRPNMALFESTVKIVHGSFVVYGDISRVNRYGTQPDCIVKSHPYLRRFCLCRH